MYTGEHQLRVQADNWGDASTSQRPPTPQSSEALEQPSGAPRLANTLISGFWPPDYEANAFLLLNPPSASYFVTAALTNTSTALVMFPHNTKIRNFQKVTIFISIQHTIVACCGRNFKDKQNLVPALQELTGMHMFVTLQFTNHWHIVL